MRITFVLPPVNLSGGIRVVAIYAKALVERGHRVTLVSPLKPSIPLARKIKSFLAGRGWPQTEPQVSHLDDLDLDHRLLDCYRPVDSHDVPDADVVVATWWETAEWVNGLDNGKGAKAYFIQHHEVHPYLPVERCKATYRLPMHKITIAKWLVDVMRDEYGDTVVDLVPNSVDHRQFFAPVRAKQPVPTVGFLYSKSSYKGVDVALRAIGQLSRQFSDLRVISFGTAWPNWGAAQWPIIEFHHSPPQQAIRDLYAQCDLWLTASRTEGFNLPAMEAMACRTPVVTTRAGWPAEAVETGKNGALVDVDDDGGLARSAAAILSSPDHEWRTMSQNAYDTVADSSWEASAVLFEAALEHACRRARAGEVAGYCQNTGGIGQ